MEGVETRRSHPYQQLVEKQNGQRHQKAVRLVLSGKFVFQTLVINFAIDGFRDNANEPDFPTENISIVELEIFHLRADK